MQITCWEGHPATELGGFIGCSIEGCPHRKPWASEHVATIRWNELKIVNNTIHRCVICNEIKETVIICCGTVPASIVVDELVSNAILKKHGLHWCRQDGITFIRCLNCICCCSNHSDLPLSIID